MENGSSLLRWAPRVSRLAIYRLYASDAAGRLDEALLDEVAYGLYSRCQSIIEVTEAEHGRVSCPVCSAVFQRAGGENEILRCPQCGWQTSWRAYLKTYQGKQLSGGSAIGAFREYVEKFPRARAVEEKMLLVDWLIHEVHKTTLRGEEMEFWRPAAVNLIEGNMTRVTAFLEELAGQPGYDSALRARQERWQETVLPKLWSKN